MLRREAYSEGNRGEVLTNKGADNMRRPRKDPERLLNLIRSFDRTIARYKDLIQVAELRIAQYEGKIVVLNGGDKQ